MDKEILKRYDDLAEGFKQIGGHAWDVYVKGVFVESLLYVILGVIAICVAIILGIISYRLMNKKAYHTPVSREISVMTGEVKVVEDKPIRDTDKENVYAFLSVLLAAIAIIIGGNAFMLLYHNVIGVFAPEYEAIKRIIETVKESS